MDPHRMPDTILGPYRVLDLTDEKGLICGKILGDMGADVIKVEPPGGDPARTFGPFYQDIPHPERSLYWWAFNLNKRSVTLNLETEDGRALFRRLAASVDFVVESFPPGHLDGLGLGYATLSAINPRIILTSITPFGQTGPYSHFAASDITLQGMGAHMYVSGDEDRAPVRISFPISYCHGGTEAAVSSLIAHYYRERTGEGQHVDVSIQECVVWTLMNTTVTWDLLHRDVMRGGPLRRSPQTGLVSRVIWPCKDGLVTFNIAGGARAQSQAKLVQWMRQEGYADDALVERDWSALDLRSIAQEEYDAIARQVYPFFLTKTIAELYQRAVQDRLLLAPITTVKDILESPQLAAREYFVEVEHPELQLRFIYPGAFVKYSLTPVKVYRRPPLIGEHNQEIYGGELGYNKGALRVLRERNVI